MVRPTVGTPNWGDDLNTDLDGIEATAQAAAADAADALSATSVTDWTAISAGGPTTVAVEVKREGNRVGIRLVGVVDLTGKTLPTLPSGFEGTTVPQIAVLQADDSSVAGFCAVQGDTLTTFRSNGDEVASAQGEFWIHTDSDFPTDLP